MIINDGDGLIESQNWLDGATNLHTCKPKHVAVKAQENVKLLTYEPRHEISNNVVCATSKVSDQPAHARSLIRAIASRLNILRLLQNVIY